MADITKSAGDKTPPPRQVSWWQRPRVKGVLAAMAIILAALLLAVLLDKDEAVAPTASVSPSSSASVNPEAGAPANAQPTITFDGCQPEGGLGRGEAYADQPWKPRLRERVAQSSIAGGLDELCFARDVGIVIFTTNTGLLENKVGKYLIASNEVIPAIRNTKGDPRAEHLPLEFGAQARSIVKVTGRDIGNGMEACKKEYRFDYDVTANTLTLIDTGPCQ